MSTHEWTGMLLAGVILAGTACAPRPQPGTPAQSEQGPTTVRGQSEVTTSPAMKAREPAKIYTDWPSDAKEAARRQEETASNLGIQKELTVALAEGKDLKMKLALIPAGRFMMGTPKSEFRCINETQHEVIISQPFYIGVHEVTREQFEAFVRDTNYQTLAEKQGQGNWRMAPCRWGPVEGISWRNPGFAQTGTHPVVHVAWSDAVAFCKWLSAKTDRAFFMPTEAQWEYACRAGTNTSHHWGNVTQDKDARGWCNVFDKTLCQQFPEYRHLTDSPWRFSDGYPFTAPVGSFPANAWGLYDMHGNVSEMCSDWFDDKYYEKTQKKDPRGPDSGETRVTRGGSWNGPPAQSRSAYRGGPFDSYRSSYNGFRVVAQVRAAKGRSPAPKTEPAKTQDGQTAH